MVSCLHSLIGGCMDAVLFLDILWSLGVLRVSILMADYLCWSQSSSVALASLPDLQQRNVNMKLAVFLEFPCSCQVTQTSASFQTTACTLTSKRRKTWFPPITAWLLLFRGNLKIPTDYRSMTGKLPCMSENFDVTPVLHVRSLSPCITFLHVTYFKS